MGENAHRHSGRRADGTRGNRDADVEEQQEEGKAIGRGHDPKITLSRDKSFFRNAAIANSTPTPLQIPNMVFPWGPAGVISIQGSQ